MTELSTVRELIQQGIDDGLHPGAQVYVSRGSKVVADFAMGEARQEPESVPMTTETLTLWRSACKPITAVAVAQQWEQGRLDLDEPVATYLPAFGQGGKEAVTIRHVLTHTGGFPATRFQYPPDDWDTIIEKICAMPLDPEWADEGPGGRAAYHIHSGWYILGELVQRVSNQPLPVYLREHVFEPTGMSDSWIGMPVEQFRSYGNRIAVMMDTFKKPAQSMGWDTEEWVTQCQPSGNGFGPARELARFYEMLMAGGEARSSDGPSNPVLKPETVQLFTARHREGMYDHTFRHVMDWGLGFIRDAKRHGAAQVPYGYGAHASDATFGHSGSQSSAAFADPEHDLAVAVVFNGSPGEPRHQKRIHAVLTALYEDLGLTA